MNLYLLYSEDNTGIVIGAILGFIIYMAILHNLISSATRSRKIEAQLFIQSMFLKDMALKNGVTPERVAEILEAAKKL
jgi:hypothetical protein